MVQARPSFALTLVLGLLVAGCVGPRLRDGTDGPGAGGTDCPDGLSLQPGRRMPSGISRSFPTSDAPMSPRMPGTGVDCPSTGGADATWDWIDTHAHPFAGPGDPSTCYDAACLESTEAKLSEWDVRVSFMMPMPTHAGRSGETDLAEGARSDPDRFRFLNGGFSLMPLLHEAGEAGSVSADLQSRFDDAADTIAAQGALGYGELAALHVSFNPQHPFEEYAPDHALFLRLADHAARHGIVIDLHMDLVAADKATPAELLAKSSNNPSTLKANQPGLERLLAHNREAKILLVHVGWDNVGDMTTAVLDGLLDKHPNLYMQIKGPFPPPVFDEHSVLDAAGEIRPEWLRLLQEHPDRFVVGSDVLYGMAEVQVDMALRHIHDILSGLPADLREKVAIDNPVAIYGLEDAAAASG